MIPFLLFLLLTHWDVEGVLEPSLRSLVGDSGEASSLEEESLKELLLRRVGTRGFFEAAFETTSTDTSRILRLVWGRRYEVGRVVVDGSAVGTERERALLEGLAGSPWDADAITLAMERLVRAHEEIGYPFASLAIRHYDVDTLSGSISLRIGVTPGPRTKVERVDLPPGVRTRGRVAARLAGIGVGRYYRQSQMDAAVGRLKASGYFASVGSLTLTSGTNPHSVVVHIPLTERATHSLRGAVGFSRRSALVGSVQARLRNIAGTAREASVTWQARGAGRVDLGLGYREPWLLGLPPSLEVEVHHSSEDTLWVEREGAIGLSWNLGGGVTGSLGYRARRVIPGDTEAFPPTRSTEAWGRAVWDRLDADFLPPRGLWVHLEGAYRTLANLSSGGEFPVVRLELDARRAFGVGPSASVVMSGSVRLAIHGEPSLPVPERYPLGGARSVRGYREGQFRTDGAGWASLECHRASPTRTSSVFVFADVGVCRGEDDDVFLVGLGPGVTARTSLGLAEIAYGVPRGSSVLEGRVHLSFGRSF